MENWLAIGVLIFLIGMILYGHYKGFIRLAVSLVALVATLVIVNLAMPQVTRFLKQETGIYQMIEKGMKSLTKIDDLPKEEAEVPSLQREVIEHLNLPKQVKDLLIENNNNEVYQILGVDAFVDYIASYLGNIMINVIGFVILFIVVFFVIQIIMSWLDLVTRLPILFGINKIMGAILGGVEGLLILWILCIVLALVSRSQIGTMLLAQVDGNPWLSLLYYNNVISKMLMHIVRGI